MRSQHQSRIVRVLEKCVCLSSQIGLGIGYLTRGAHFVWLEKTDGLSRKEWDVFLAAHSATCSCASESVVRGRFTVHLRKMVSSSPLSSHAKRSNSILAIAMCC